MHRTSRICVQHCPALVRRHRKPIMPISLSIIHPVGVFENDAVRSTNGVRWCAVRSAYSNGIESIIIIICDRALTSTHTQTTSALTKLTRTQAQLTTNERRLGKVFHKFRRYRDTSNGAWKRQVIINFLFQSAMAGGTWVMCVCVCLGGQLYKFNRRASTMRYDTTATAAAETL